MTGHEIVLKWILRLVGCMLLLASLAVVMPQQWMASAHQALGFGPFPKSPVMEYLARSASALYATRGALMVLASSDIRRYRPLVVFLGISGCVFGIVMLAVDLKAGMPLWWTLVEGPPVLAANLLVLALIRRRQEAGHRRQEEGEG